MCIRDRVVFYMQKDDPNIFFVAYTHIISVYQSLLTKRSQAYFCFTFISHANTNELRVRFRRNYAKPLCIVRIGI